MSNSITITKRYISPDSAVGSVYVSTPTIGNAVPEGTGFIPIATTTTLGGVIVSSGLTITQEGYLSLSGGSMVDIEGTPVANQVTIWTDADTIKGTTGLTWDGNTLLIGTGSAFSGVERTVQVNGGLYLNNNLEFPAGRSIYMGSTSDTGPRFNWKQVTGGIDEGVYLDYYPKLQFRSDIDASRNKILFDSNGRAGFGFTSPLSTISINGSLHVGGESDAGDNNLLVDGNIRTDWQYNTGTFTSGFFGAGYRCKYESGISTLEIDDLIVRRKLSAYELEIREITSIGGSLVISVGNCTIYDIQGSNYIVDTDNNRNPIQFAVGDIIRAQVWTGRGIDSWIATVTSVTQSTTLGSAFFQATNLVGDGGWIGAKCVVVGSSNSARNNIIYLTAADSDNPYLSVLNGVTGSTFAGHERLRLGSLAGVNDPAFGSFAGKYGLYCDNVFLKGSIQISNPTTAGIPYAGASSAGGAATSLVNQGSLATQSSIDYTTNQLTNKPTLGSLAALNTADWSSNVSGKPGYTGPASGQGLFMNDSYFGYYDYTNYPSDPWRAYISSAGTARFTNVTEFGTQPSAGWAGLTTNVAVSGPDIYEPQYNGISALNINMKGYAGGYSQYRQLQIGDGKGTTAVMFNERTSWGGYTYGTTKFWQDVSMTEGLYVGGYFRQGDHSKDPYASLATANGINIGGVGSTSRINGGIDFYGNDPYASNKTMSISGQTVTINKPLTIHDSTDFHGGTITSTSPTINFNGCHTVDASYNDDTCAVAISDIAGFSASVTPKGDMIFISFSVPIHNTTGNQTFRMYIDVGGTNYFGMDYFIATTVLTACGSTVVSVTPNSAVTVKLRWSGTTAVQYLGSTGTYGVGQMVVLDLY